MQGIVLRTLITMLGLFLASALVPGVSISGAWTVILAAVLLGLVNAFVRPIAFVLTRDARQFRRDRILVGTVRRNHRRHHQYDRILVHRAGRSR
jgi:MFS family permease